MPYHFLKKRNFSKTILLTGYGFYDVLTAY